MNKLIQNWQYYYLLTIILSLLLTYSYLSRHNNRPNLIERRINLDSCSMYLMEWYGEILKPLLHVLSYFNNIKTPFPIVIETIVGHIIYYLEQMVDLPWYSSVKYRPIPIPIVLKCIVFMYCYNSYCSHNLRYPVSYCSWIIILIVEFLHVGSSK